jgi:hypothetical protein
VGQGLVSYFGACRLCNQLLARVSRKEWIRVSGRSRKNYILSPVWPCKDASPRTSDVIIPSGDFRILSPWRHTIEKLPDHAADWVPAGAGGSPPERFST